MGSGVEANKKVYLTKSNYLAWSTAIEVQLRLKGLWKHVLPETDTGAVPTADASNGAPKERMEACGIITKTMTEEPLLLVRRDIGNPRAMWKTLFDRYQRSGTQELMTLEERLRNVELRGRGNYADIEQFISIFEKRMLEFELAGGDMSEEKKVQLLLKNLPLTYDQCRDNVLDKPQAEITMELAKKSIRRRQMRLQENKKGNNKDVREDKETAYSVAGGKKSAKWKRRIKCYNCQKMGHFANECRLEKKETAMSTSQRQAGSSTILFDTGATSHMFRRREDFASYEELESEANVVVGNGEAVKGVARGTVLLMADNGERIRLKKVLHVPALATNLVSGTTIMANPALKLTCNANGVTVWKAGGGPPVLKACMRNGELCVQAKVLRERESAKIMATRETWHKRLGHQNERALLKTEANVLGLEMEKDHETPNVCEPCCEGKAKKRNIPKKSQTRARRPGEKLHVDPTGKMPSESIGGKRSALLITDDYSRFRWSYLVRKKSEYVGLLIGHLKRLKNGGNPTSIVVLDNELVTKKLQEYVGREGIELQATAPYEPSQNGTAERTVGLVKDVTRTNLLAASLSQKYWGEAMMTAVYQLNRRSTSANKESKTPFELWHSKQPDISNMRTFGCDAHVLIPGAKRKAWSAKTMKLKFMGYQEGTRNYRFVNKHGTIIRSPNATFTEKMQTTMPQKTKEVCTERKQRDDDEDDDILDLVESDSEDDDDIMVAPENNENENAKPRRSLRKRTPVDHGPFVAHNIVEERCFVVGISELPQSVDEALENEVWKEAMDDEFNSLMERGTWEVVDRPTDRKVVSSKWVFDLKTDEKGRIVRAKARFVARGFSQVPGVDFTESYAPVVDPAVLRLCMAYGAQRKLTQRMIDFKCSFLNGNLPEVIYLEQPQGYIVGNAAEKVLWLKKAIYGLVQAALEWRRVLVEALRNLSFVPLKTDPATFFRKEDGVILNSHVDDVNAIGDENTLIELEDALEKKFELRRLGNTKFIIGVCVEREGESVYLSQEAYIEKLLKRFMLENVNDVPTPMLEGAQLTKFQGGRSTDAFKKLYQEKVGSLQYLSKMTRLDISYPTKEVSKHCHNPGPQHMKAVNRILAYLKTTKNHRLKLNVGGDIQIRDYADADFAGNLETRRSTTGFVIMLGNAPISWRSTDQRCVSLSTLESECHALSTSVVESLWLRDVLQEINGDAERCIQCFEDNAACLVLANNESLGRAKHIATRFHFVKELVQKGEITVSGIASQEMIADALTKPVSKRRIRVVQEQLKVLSKQEECQDPKGVCQSGQQGETGNRNGKNGNAMNSVSISGEIKSSVVNDTRKGCKDEQECSNQESETLQHEA
jgi:hypothetical protein